MAKIKELTDYLESIAPLPYQEHYDNSGLIVGDPDTEIKGILICLDCTEEVVDEAEESGHNLIIAHHPIVFRGLKKLTGKNYVERTVIKAIKQNIAIYAIHTNLDNVFNGVNHKIAKKLELKKTKILEPKNDHLSKLVAFVPQENTLDVLNAIHEAGAGVIGNYDHCSFRVSGTGRYKPNEEANPHIGEKDKTEEVSENRIEAQFPSHIKNGVLNALHKAHPYEEVAYFLQDIGNYDPFVGAGVIGELVNPLSTADFLKYLKEKMSLDCIRHTNFSGNIKKVAVCGGTGSFLLSKAISLGADAFVSADFKYHEFFDSENKLMIADIGHYESEVYTKELLQQLIIKKFPNFAVNLCSVVTNPISYYY